MEVSGELHASAILWRGRYLGAHRIRRCDGLIAHMDVTTKKKFLRLAGIELWSSRRYPAYSLIELSKFMVSNLSTYPSELGFRSALLTCMWRSAAESDSSWFAPVCHLTDTRYARWCTQRPHKCASPSSWAQKPEFICSYCNVQVSHNRHDSSSPPTISIQ
jgi:hypothetical protein